MTADRHNPSAPNLPTGASNDVLVRTSSWLVGMSSLERGRMASLACSLRIAAHYMGHAEPRQAWVYANSVVPRVPAELGARVRHALDCGDYRAGAQTLDDVANVLDPPMVAEPSLKPRRQRKPSIGKMIAAAERGGKNVTSITTPDGTSRCISARARPPPRRAIRGSTISR